MSEENVELARQAFEAFNRRDPGAYLALMDADVEAGSLLVALEGGYRGHAGIRRWWMNLHEVVPDYTGEVIEVRDLGDLTLVTLRTGTARIATRRFRSGSGVSAAGGAESASGGARAAPKRKPSKPRG